MVGFEPTTPGLELPRSVHLSYTGLADDSALTDGPRGLRISESYAIVSSGVLSRGRTCDFASTARRVTSTP